MKMMTFLNRNNSRMDLVEWYVRTILNLSNSRTEKNQ